MCLMRRFLSRCPSTEGRGLSAGLKVLALRLILAAGPSGLTAFRPGSSSHPAGPGVENRPPAPIGFTKSNMTATELSCAGRIPLRGYTAAMPMTDRATHGHLDCRRADQGKRFTMRTRADDLLRVSPLSAG
jgi:hypothetical protein